MYDYGIKWLGVCAHLLTMSTMSVSGKHTHTHKHTQDSAGRSCKSSLNVSRCRLFIHNVVAASDFAGPVINTGQEAVAGGSPWKRSKTRHRSELFAGFHFLWRWFEFLLLTKSGCFCTEILYLYCIMLYMYYFVHNILSICEASICADIWKKRETTYIFWYKQSDMLNNN